MRSAAGGPFAFAPAPPPFPEAAASAAQAPPSSPEAPTVAVRVRVAEGGPPAPAGFSTCKGGLQTLPEAAV